MIKFIDALFSIYVIANFLPGLFIYKKTSLFQVAAIPIVAIMIVVLLHKSALKGFKICRIDMALIFLFMLSLLSYFWSVNKVSTLEEIQKFSYVIIGFFITQIFIFILSKYKNLNDIVLKISKIIFFSGLVLALSVIIDGLNLFDFHSHVGWQEEYRSVGLLGRPNFGAAILNICLVFIYTPIHKKKKKGIIFSAAAFPIYTTAIFLTGSRMGVGLLALNILFLVLNLKKYSDRKSKVIFCYVLIITVGLGTLLFIGQFGRNLYLFESFNRLAEYQRGENVNIRRLEILKFGKELLQQKQHIWLFGIGFGGFEYFSEIYLEEPKSTHNLYLELLIGLGLGGLLLFLYFQIKLIASVRSLIRHSDRFIERSLVTPYLYALVLIYLEFFFLTDLRVNKIIWVIFGTICVLQKCLLRQFEGRPDLSPGGNKRY